jgi:small subunit ribosomal protein S18
MDENTQEQQKNILELTYLDVDQMRRFVTDTGKILPRRITGLSPKEQRHLARTIKTSRSMLLMK